MKVCVDCVYLGGVYCI